MSLELDQVVAAILGAAVCGAAGATAMPRLVARLPEPEPYTWTEEPGEKVSVAEAARRAEAPKQPYPEMAADPTFVRALTAFSALAGLLLGGWVGLRWPLLLVLPVVPLGAALGVVDWRCRQLPRQLTWLVAAVLFGYALVAWLLTGHPESLVRALVGLGIAYLFFGIAWFVYPPGFAFGDVRISGLLGFLLAYAGWAEFAVGLYAPFLLFGVPGVVNAVVRRDLSLLKVGYPFGPAMLVGAVLGLVAGAPIAAALTG